MSYAIAFDLDTDTLSKAYPGASWNNAYADIKKTLEGLGFAWQQGSIYFGNDKVTAVTCVLAAQQLSQKYAWFKASARDIRMMRIEEMNDLSVAL